jgi:hypothetical protein
MYNGITNKIYQQDAAARHFLARLSLWHSVSKIIEQRPPPPEIFSQPVFACRLTISLSTLAQRGIIIIITNKPPPPEIF